jgi:hypothetical protein
MENAVHIWSGAAKYIISAPMLAIGIALLIHSAWMPRRLKPE